MKKEKNELTVWGAKKLKPVNVFTHEYPGFATDLQPPFTLLMTQAKGTSLIHDSIFDGRLMFTDILNLMGADIIMNDPHRVTVNGPTKLRWPENSQSRFAGGDNVGFGGAHCRGKNKN